MDKLPCDILPLIGLYLEQNHENYDDWINALLINKRWYKIHQPLSKRVLEDFYKKYRATPELYKSEINLPLWVPEYIFDRPMSMVIAGPNRLEKIKLVNHLCENLIQNDCSFYLFTDTILSEYFKKELFLGINYGPEQSFIDCIHNVIQERTTNPELQKKKTFLIIDSDSLSKRFFSGTSGVMINGRHYNLFLIIIHYNTSLMPIPWRNNFPLWFITSPNTFTNKEVEKLTRSVEHNADFSICKRSEICVIERSLFPKTFQYFFPLWKY